MRPGSRTTARYHQRPSRNPAASACRATRESHRREIAVRSPPDSAISARHATRQSHGREITAGSAPDSAVSASHATRQSHGGELGMGHSAHPVQPATPHPPNTTATSRDNRGEHRAHVHGPLLSATGHPPCADHLDNPARYERGDGLVRHRDRASRLTGTRHTGTRHPST